MSADSIWLAPTLPRLEVVAVGRRTAFAWGERWLRPVRLRFWIAYWDPAPGAALLSAGRTWPLLPDRLVLIPPDTPFQRRVSAPFDHWWCHFLVHGPGQPPAGIQQLAVDAACRNRLDALWHDLDAGANPGSAARLAAFLLDRLAQLAWTAPPSLGDARLDRLLAGLAAEGWPALGNAALAARLGMHPKAMCRRFAQVVGVPPQDWLRQRRIERAAELLSTGHGVAEAAEATGFADRYHFTRVFRRTRGLGPGTYRRLAGR